MRDGGRGGVRGFFLLGQGGKPVGEVCPLSRCPIHQNVGYGSIAGIEPSRPKYPLTGRSRTNVAPIETEFLSVRILADQVREFAQVGDHGIGLDRRVIGAGST